MQITDVIIQQVQSDGYKLIAEYEDGTERELPGWHSSQEAAAEAATGYHVPIHGLPASMGGRDMWQAPEWLHESAATGVTSDMSDAELEKLAYEYERDAYLSNVELTTDILEYLREVRAEKQQNG